METHVEIYKNHRIRIEHDEYYQNPFEDWNCWPEGMKIACKDLNLLDGDMNVDEFHQMIQDFELFVEEQLGYEFVTNKSNNGKWYTFDQWDKDSIVEAIKGGGSESRDESIIKFAKDNKIPCEEDYYWLPVYKYEHSGVIYNTTGFSCPWDSGQVGYIYIPKDIAVKEWELDTEEKALKYLRSTIKTLSDWASGECYGYIIEKETTCTCGEHTEWEEIDSCWGFLGEMEYCLEEAKNYLN